jgi:hypothetical protein
MGVGDIGEIGVIGGGREGRGKKKEMKMAEMMTEQARMTSNLPKRRGINLIIQPVYVRFLTISKVNVIK